MEKYSHESEMNATEELSSYTNQSTADMEAYIKRLRERTLVNKSRVEQEASEARKKYWEEFEARKL